MIRLLFVAALLIAPRTASAVAHVVSAGRVKIAETEVVVVPDATGATITTRLKLDGRAKDATLLFVVPKDVVVDSIRLVDAAAMTDLQHRTEPRYVTFHPPDPCVRNAVEERNERRAWPDQRRTITTEHTAEHVPLNGMKKFAKDAKPGVQKALRRSRGGLVALRLSKLGRVRGQWTPPVQWRVTGAPAVAAALVSHHTPGGQEHKLTLFTIGKKIVAPKGPTENLPRAANLPEIALESPRDTTRAIVRHLIRRKGGDRWIQVYAGEAQGLPEVLGATAGVLARFVTVLTPKQKAVSFEQKVLLRPHAPELLIRRVWRKPFECEAPRFVNNVRIQQMAELRAYVAMTGRPLQVVLDQSRSRGYAQHADGTVDPVTPKYPDGAID